MIFAAGLYTDGYYAKRKNDVRNANFPLAGKEREERKSIR